VKDIPMFTTQWGVASLILAEVPYRQTAYIRILDVQPGSITQLVEECLGFCRAVGAERVYATGCDELGVYPFHASILEMQTAAQPDEEDVAALWPVSQENVTFWRSLWNEKSVHVDNAGTITAQDEQKVLSSCGAYFVHRGDQLLGIGWLVEDELSLIASCIPGAGKTVLNAMLSLRSGSTVKLEVASTNLRAISLYERMGFVKTREVSRWYKVL